MKIVYDSLMGKTEKFVRKTGFPHIKISPELEVTEPFVLVTYTTGRGEVPETTTNFLSSNHANLVAVACSGHRNWGVHNFCKAGEIVAKKYKVPVLLKFEMVGSKTDVEKFIGGVLEIEKELFGVQQ